MIATASARPRAAPDRTAWAIEVHADLDALAGLWPRCAADGAPHPAVCHVFQTAEFIANWLETYGRAIRARPLFVLVREADGSPLLLLPLAIVRRGAARILTFLDADACDYNAPVLFPTARTWTPEAAAALWGAVKASLPAFDLAVLARMPAEVAGRVNPLYLLTAVGNPESCHVNDLARPWPEVESGVHGLRTLRKSARALERIAPTRLEVAETPEARAAILAAMLRQKQRRFEETRVPGFDAQPEKRAFFERATEMFAARGSLHLAALRVGDEIVASAWGLVHAGRYYGLMIGFEAGAWASYSPGRVLYLMLLRALHARGCAVLDLGIGNESWKLAQCDGTVPLRRHVEAVGWRGSACLRQNRAVAHLRGSGLWRRLRPYKWIVLRGLRRRRPDADGTAAGAPQA